ncbi:alpha/beta fold hydrolase [Paractinoplanes brasiliensis]|uniref:Pimeloyl-ACP methyl ester carboxylesterase n=1 Tax=Paractinoplanes brasiliensis TaxID=52695 RepID=A0A4R6JNS5_9ACTN|nr:alpha/beta hydrolase [Actinoplanes brasiliensis]TDO37031.1 pimeloyl-ACP methyl ester carboxylesterase [Actinoplanes brasiliensis]
MKPTIVLVHGAFAESASWNGVITRLLAAGYRTLAVGNPLRSLSGDAAAVASLLATIEGPVVLAGHSYGGAVASNAAAGNENVKALVYVAALAPDRGENVPDLTGRFPGATLGEHLHEVPLDDGTTDLYVRLEAYHEHFAADVPAADAALAAATQRPANSAAFAEGSAEPAWKMVPSWFISPERDRAIPLESFRFMAERANAREAVEVEGASHALPMSQPQAVADIILRAVDGV